MCNMQGEWSGATWLALAACLHVHKRLAAWASVHTRQSPAPTGSTVLVNTDSDCDWHHTRHYKHTLTTHVLSTVLYNTQPQRTHSHGHSCTSPRVGDAPRLPGTHRNEFNTSRPLQQNWARHALGTANKPTGSLKVHSGNIQGSHFLRSKKGSAVGVGRGHTGWARHSVKSVFAASATRSNDQLLQTTQPPETRECSPAGWRS